MSGSKGGSKKVTARDAASAAEKKLKTEFCSRWQREADQFKIYVSNLRTHAAELNHTFDRLKAKRFNNHLADVVALSMLEHPQEVQEWYIRHYLALIIQLEEGLKFFLNGRILNEHQQRFSVGNLCPKERFRNYFNNATTEESKKSDIQLSFASFEGITKLSKVNSMRMFAEYKSLVEVRCCVVEFVNHERCKTDCFFSSYRQTIFAFKRTTNTS
jgi:hypothetical protein